MTGLAAHSDGTYALRYMAGVKVFERTKYRITTQRERHWWWGMRETFSIESEFMTLGGFETFTDARSAIRACGGKYVEALSVATCLMSGTGT